jgi:hypothetical protein
MFSSETYSAKNSNTTYYRRLEKIVYTEKYTKTSVKSADFEYNVLKIQKPEPKCQILKKKTKTLMPHSRAFGF